MPTKIAALRRRAARAQNYLCFYCCRPMWDSDLQAFAVSHGLTCAQARAFQCTAEHLQARSQAGKDVPGNIVAACLFCNGSRHKAKNPKDPLAFRSFVANRMAKGQWATPSPTGKARPGDSKGTGARM